MKTIISSIPVIKKSKLAKKDSEAVTSCCAPRNNASVCCTPDEPAEGGPCCAQPADGSPCCDK